MSKSASRRMFYLCQCICFMCLFSVTVTSQAPRFIRPSTTDTAIINNDNNHIVFYPEAHQARGKLFVFLPGTGGVPLVYLRILSEAATSGFHSIGLTYHNDVAVNLICGATLDTTCHRRARHENLDGLDRHDFFEIDSTHSIYNRLLALLHYLDAQYPEEGWGAYFAEDGVTWQKILHALHPENGPQAGSSAK